MDYCRTVLSIQYEMLLLDCTVNTVQETTVGLYCTVQSTMWDFTVCTVQDTTIIQGSDCHINQALCIG